MRRSTAIHLASGASAVLSVCLLAAAPATRPPGGASAGAQVARITLKDAARNKSLNISVAFPATLPAGERFPYIIVSHGAGASGRTLEPLLAKLAAAGYVAIAPTHTDSLANSDRPKSGTSVDAKASQKVWEERIVDVEMLIDREPDVEAAIPAIAGHVDREKLAVAGHSLGAFTAMLLGGATPTWDGTERDLHDKRVKAIVILSGQGPGQYGLTETSFKSLTIPALIVTGTQDRSTPAEHPGQPSKKLFDLTPAPDKFLLVLEGANPFSFVGTTAAQKKFADATANTSIAFLDAYLKADADKRDMMISGSAIAPFSSIATIQGK